MRYLKLLILFVFIIQSCSFTIDEPKLGEYRAEIKTKDGSILPFKFVLFNESDKLIMKVENDKETLIYDDIVYAEDSIKILMPPYDAVIIVKSEGETLKLEIMVFSTDKFTLEFRKQLNQIADDFVNDMIHDAVIVANRLKEDDDDALTHMNEIGSLAEMCTNMKYDCDALANAFEDVFRREHGSGKEAATGLDAMRIITEISNDINVIAPHISWLFEDSDCNIIQNIYNSSFFAPVEGQPV